MNPKDAVKQYLPQINIMQLATSLNDQPYICTVHYYSDGLDLYWTSMLERHHSKEIERNPNVSAYVLVHENTPSEDYVIGVTFIGKAELIGSKVSPEIAKLYAQKLRDDPEFVNKVANDTTPFKFYKLTSQKIVLFNNKDFPENPRQEITL